jgi:hypothetical protein
MLGGLRSLLLALPAAAGVLAAALLLAARDPDEPTRCDLLVPAYVPPDALSQLARTARPRLLVVNPASGPGRARDDRYAAAVREAQRTGTRVLGYVATGYGTRPKTDVDADVDRYRAWYGTDGVFLDEAAPAPSQLGHYRALADRARAAGARLVVLNPGTVPDRGYFDVGDVVVTFEGPYDSLTEASGRMPDWVPRERSAVLVYGATPAQAATVAEHTEHAGYVYATSGRLPHPWGTVPAHLLEENGPLAGCGSPVNASPSEVTP